MGIAEFGLDLVEKLGDGSLVGDVGGNGQGFELRVVVLHGRLDLVELVDIGRDEDHALEAGLGKDGDQTAAAHTARGAGDDGNLASEGIGRVRGVDGGVDFLVVVWRELLAV